MIQSRKPAKKSNGLPDSRDHSDPDESFSLTCLRDRTSNVFFIFLQSMVRRETSKMYASGGPGPVKAQ